MPSDPDWSETGIGGAFGWSVAGASNVNGDAFDDVIIGAPQTVNGGSDVGAVYVYYGSDDGPSSNPWIEYGELTSPYLPTRFGYSVAGIGDVDNDTFGDILVGAPGRVNYPGTWAGRAYIYLGSNGGLSATAAWTTDGPADDSYYGWRVAAAGDVDGDDIPDFAISGPGASNDPGVVYLFLGVDGDIPDTAEASSASGSGQGANTFGLEGLAGVGDINGDGFDDIMISQSGFFDEFLGSGRLLLFYGGN